MKNIAIIPARSGSKGLINKNIRELLGKPLLAYSIDEAIKSGQFDEIMVSTDSEKYAEIAQEYGAHIPFLRSEEQSSDSAGSWEVVKEVLMEYRERGVLFDTVCLLQPTSPLRTAGDIIGCYRDLEVKGADAITTVCEMEHSPLWSMTLDQSMSLSEYRNSMIENIPRQKLAQYYRINGAVYIRKVNYTSENVEILCNCEYAYVMDKDKSVDIDELIDFELAELLMRKRNNEEN